MMADSNGHFPFDALLTTEYPAVNVASKASGSDAADKQIDEAISNSVQVNLPPFWGSRWFGVGGYEWTLPGVQSPERCAYLGQVRYHPQNIVFQAAAYALISQFISSSWELVGDRRAKFFQNVLMNADRGHGWDSFWQRVWWDFLTLDDGAVIEVIGGGEPDTALKRELVVGIGHLDPMRCYFTDNYEYPVFYQDYYGKLHKMHHSRVIRLVDMPLPYVQSFGRGFCALSRVIAAAQQSITLMTYTGEMLSNEPPPGLMNVGNVLDPIKFEQSYDQYNAQRRAAGNSTYKPIWKHINPGGKEIGKAEVEFVRFSQEPEGYDFEKYLRLQAQLVAAGIGMDSSDILPLVSGEFGTGEESRVLDRKGKGKMIAVMFKMAARELNRSVLPENLEWKSKHQDSEQSREEVETAKAQLEIAVNIQVIGISQQAIHMYVANTVPTFKDVLLDENGELRVYDDDPKPTAPLQPTDNLALTEGDDAIEPTPTKDDISAQVDSGNPETPKIDDNQKALALAFKDFEDIRTRYTADLYDAWQGLNDGSMDRRRAGIIARALVSRDGRQAYIEGLAQGGVIVDTLEGDDLDRYNTLVIEASGYISNTTENIVKQGMSDDEIRNSTEAYANKTLTKFYYWGIESGDKNGLYRFEGSDGKESCSDCQRLKGKAYRMYEWTDAKMRPGVDTENFECGGWNCAHYLAKYSGRRSRGSVKMLSVHVH